MTMIDVGTTTRPEGDYLQIARLSAIGSLADSVLRELITFESGNAPRPLFGITRAAEFFRRAASGAGQPRSIWSAPTLADELLYFSAGGPENLEGTGAPANDDARPWMDEVASALEAVSVGSPTLEEIERVRSEFAKIADHTMRFASQLVDARHAS